MADTNKLQSLEDSDTSPAKKYKRWITEVNMAEKELEDFIKGGNTVYERYKDERKDNDSGVKKFNVFWTNIGIMQSSLFANIPKVSVERRFGQNMDDVARVASMMIQNSVMQDMEDENCNFAQVMKYAITDRLVPGWGHAWLRLETETEEMTLEEITDELTGEVIQEASTFEQITGQEVCIDYVHWNDFLISPCRTYEERRWVGRKVYMGRDDLTERFGEEVGAKISLDYNAKEDDDDSPENNIVEKAIVYELWDRVKKEVIWITKGYPKLLDVKEDPLGLDAFDPCPRPIFATQTTSNVIPKSDYAMLQDQYGELDEVNNRISMLVKACKVVGVYDSSASKSIGRMLEEGEDNTLIPVENWAMFSEKGGIKGVIDWIPLNEVIQALEKLRQAREDIKGQIYELTGISDIVRGNTKASETLGAQQIKAQFASVRIQKQQDEIALFAQEILNMKAEIICKHFTPAQIIEQSNFKYYLDAQNQPLMGQAVELIKGEYEKFQWRVKVQADSLAMADQQMLKQEKVEFINAVATFMQSAASMMQAQPGFAPIMMNTLKFTISGFKGASELEGMIDQTIEKMMAEAKQKEEQAKNQPPPPTPEQIKMQMEQQKSQMDMQNKQQSAQMDSAKKQEEIQYKQKLHEMDLRHQAMMDNMELQNKKQQNMMDAIKKQTDMMLSNSKPVEGRE
jgi:hypothetical protein